MNAQRKPQPSEEAALTIDELAQSVGMTVRNLREWRTLGLIPPAEIRGRVGYYDPSVVTRVEWIQQLHDQGFPLELIRRLLDASNSFGDDVMQLASALRAPFREEAPPLLDVEEWVRRWGSVTPADLRRAVELGVIRKRADGQLEFTSARIARVADALHSLGLSLEEALTATAEIRAHADGVAEQFEGLWMRHVWEPFTDAGMPEDGLPQVRTTLAEMQPLALEAVIAVFTVAMEARIEQGIARELKRAAGEAP